MWRSAGRSVTFVALLASASSRLTDDLRQPTLNDPPDGRRAHDAGRLTLLDLVAARALDLSRTEAAPLAPSLTLSRQVLSTLAEKGIVRLVSNDDCQPTTIRSVYGQFAWSAAANFPLGAELARSLRGYVGNPVRRDAIRHEQVAVWRRLAEAELEGYARHLLRGAGAAELSIGRLMGLFPALLRTVSTAAVRRALWLHLRGPQLVQPPTSPPDAAASFAEQLAARIFTTALLVQGQSANRQFIPAEKSPTPLMRSVFLSDACALGSRYWSCCPSPTHLAPELDADGHRRIHPSHHR